MAPWVLELLMCCSVLCSRWFTDVMTRFGPLEEPAGQLCSCFFFLCAVLRSSILVSIGRESRETPRWCVGWNIRMERTPEYRRTGEEGVECQHQRKVFAQWGPSRVSGCVWRMSIIIIIIHQPQ
uniref:Putative secreted protein n=1 Tax=Anopheles marajoara TaxID=58244 RepID=A0A2M4C752_9DIPT